MTIEELNHKMKEHGLQLDSLGVKEADLQYGELSYYNETNCFAVLFSSVIINKRCIEYSVVVIDEVVMLW